MGMAGASVMAVAIGCVLGWWYQPSTRSVRQQPETRSTQERLEAARAVASHLGGGAFTELTQVKGTVRGQAPFISAFAKIPWVYYTMTITRQDEAAYQERDQAGRLVTWTRQGRDVAANNERLTLFHIDAQTGHITVEPTDGQCTTAKV
jgi:hypothetical protein